MFSRARAGAACGEGRPCVHPARTVNLWRRRAAQLSV
jgi:hypothetical protein